MYIILYIVYIIVYCVHTLVYIINCVHKLLLNTENQIIWKIKNTVLR